MFLGLRGKTALIGAASKGLGYAIALSGFRGGPVFPGMFIGAVGGIALSHLPGLPMIAGAAGAGAELVLLTETFSTGFSVDTDGFVDRCRRRNRMQMLNVALRAAVVGGSLAAVVFGAGLTVRRFFGRRQ